MEALVKVLKVPGDFQQFSEYFCDNSCCYKKPYFYTLYNTLYNDMIKNVWTIPNYIGFYWINLLFNIKIKVIKLSLFGINLY